MARRSYRRPARRMARRRPARRRSMRSRAISPTRLVRATRRGMQRIGGVRL